MGMLQNILSNPALIGMAMAGLSRDPEAPMNAVRTYSAMDEMQRRRQLEAKQEAERLANAKLLSAIQQQRGTDQNMLSEAIESFGEYRGIPRTVQQATPNPMATPESDYDTAFSGQAPIPREVISQVANPNRMAARQAVYQKLAQMHRRPPMDFSQFAEADPKVILSAMSHMDASSPAQKFMDMMDKNKPISMKEGETLVDPDTYEPVANVPKKKTLADKRMEAVEDPSILDGLDPRVLQILGANPKTASTPNTKTEIIYALENEQDPAKKVVLQKVLKRIEDAERTHAALGRAPQERYHFSTDKFGNVWHINKDTGAKTNMGQVGRPGTLNFMDQMKEMSGGGQTTPTTQPNMVKPDPLGIRK